MTLKYVTGNIVELIESGEFDVVVHGCNCKNTMNSGVAKALRDKWPQVYDADTLFGHVDDSIKLGHYSQAYVLLGTRATMVINAYIQYSYGYDGACYVEPWAIDGVFRKLASVIRGGNLSKILIPKIGCGRAGGDWKVISEIIDKAMPEFDITVVEFGGTDDWKTTRYKCGDFVVSAENPKAVALIAVDQTPYSDKYLVRWLADGQVSTREHTELVAISPDKAVRLWCDDAIAFQDTSDET